MPHPLDSFFAPQSIALIGASRDHEKIPGRLLSMLRKNGYPGKLYLINPNYAEIDGLACTRSVAEIGAPIDLAIIVIPTRVVLSALEQCAVVGVKNAVIISSGFAEEGGESAAMQDAIAALAKRTAMRISGPNAEGFYSQVQRVAATFSPAVDVKPGIEPLVATTKRIGIVAQSGGIGFAIFNRAKALGIALSYVVSAGTCRPCADTVSAPQMPPPPDTVSTATRSPFGSGLAASTAAIATASSRSLETMKPYRANTASYAPDQPAMLAVCEAAARKPACERPTLTTMTGFLRLAALRAAARNLSTSRMPSMNSRITSVDASCTR